MDGLLHNSHLKIFMHESISYESRMDEKKKYVGELCAMMDGHGALCGVASCAMWRNLSCGNSTAHLGVRSPRANILPRFTNLFVVFVVIVARIQLLDILQKKHARLILFFLFRFVGIFFVCFSLFFFFIFFYGNRVDRSNDYLAEFLMAFHVYF